MKLLAFDSSSRNACIALVEFDPKKESNDFSILGESYITTQKLHSDLMNAQIDEIMDGAKVKFSELDLIGTGVGPGSFTGIRVSTNIAKTIGFALNKPLVTFNSLELLSVNEIGTTLCLVNAHKNSFYCAFFNTKVGGLENGRESGGDLEDGRESGGDSMVNTRVEKHFKIGSNNFPQVVPHKDFQKFVDKWKLQFPISCLGDGFQLLNEEIFSGYREKLIYKETEVSSLVHNLSRVAIQKWLRGYLINWHSLLPLYLRDVN